MTKQKSYKPFYLIISMILLTLFLCIGLLLLYQNYHKVSWSNHVLPESTTALDNPDRGFYHIYGYTLSDHNPISMDGTKELIKTDSKTRLVQIQINLKEYNNSLISQEGLAQLDTILSTWQTSNKKILLRFLYDWDGNASKTDPAHISTVLTHIEQVSSYVNKYATLIYTLQGIFIGSYGEMHSSPLMTDENMITIIQAMDSLFDSSIFFAVRTPAHERTITSRLSLSHKIGLFNDGMLGSETDLGTYSTSPNSYGKWSRNEELNYQYNLCKLVPNGGEVVISNPYNDLYPSILDMETMHISYLNQDYSPEVLDKWRNTTYQNDNDLYSGMTGFDYISLHLGYRYVLRNTEFHRDSSFSKKGELIIHVENVGFANSYRDFTPLVLLKDITTGTTYSLPIASKTTTWLSKEIVSLQIPLSINELGIGNYELYLQLLDPITLETIAFANAMDSNSDSYYLGNLLIDK